MDSLACCVFVSPSENDDNDPEGNDGSGRKLVSSHYTECELPFNSPEEIVKFVMNTQEAIKEVHTLTSKMKNMEREAQLQNGVIKKLQAELKKAIDCILRKVAAVFRRNGLDEELEEIRSGDLSSDEAIERGIKLIESLPETDQEIMKQEVTEGIPEATTSNWKYVLWGVMIGAVAGAAILTAVTGGGALAIVGAGAVAAKFACTAAVGGAVTGAIGGGIVGYYYGKDRKKKEA